MDRRPQKPTGVFDVLLRYTPNSECSRKVFKITWYEEQNQLLSNYLSGSARTFE